MRKPKCKPKERHRIVLTAIFSVIIFLILVITMLIVGAFVVLLVKTGILTGGKPSTPMLFSFLLITVPSSIVVGTVIAAVISHIPLKPIHEIISGMNKLASGDYSARIRFRGPGLAKEVSKSFNTLAEELENTEMLRSDFVNNFSHEFKTPIVSIYGFAKILRKGGLTDEQREEYLAVIEEESARLSSMATNVLNLTKIENQSILANVSSFNLSEQLRNSVLMFEKRWSDKNIEIKIDFNEYMITADEELLKQVWINLIDNAIKFTPENGEIEIKIRDEKDSVTVSVVNSGSNIPKEEQKRIFGKFYQSDSSHSMKGNGIGLAIVKKITQLHKGTVTVESENNVTAFSVCLPKTES